MSIHFEVDADRALAEIDRLAKGPDTSGFEAALLNGLMETSAKVHVITGYLKGEGHPESEYDEGKWTGTIAFPRRPGIFELARGDSPTANHPEGGHFFFDPAGEDYVKAVKRELEDFVTDGEGLE